MPLSRAKVAPLVPKLVDGARRGQYCALAASPLSQRERGRGGVSGSPVDEVSAMGSVMIQMMKKEGFDTY